MISPFSIARLPRIEFGSGVFRKLPDIAVNYGKHLLLVTGARSFLASPHAAWLFDALRQRGCSWEIVKVAGEPAPTFIDATVAALREESFAAVIGIGGGSALDAAKAIAGLLKPGNSVMDHLEGVGPELPYRGPATPFIAVPTTAGTGSEATKNAVLSLAGQFKKSFRDDQLVAEWAIVDPDLIATCPPHLIAADGMDAFTQLLESFVSTRSNPMTDALARSGIMAVQGLPAVAPCRTVSRGTREDGLRFAHVGHLPRADRTRFGAWPRRAARRLLPDTAWRGLRHAGRHGDQREYRGDGSTRAR